MFVAGDEDFMTPVSAVRPLESATSGVVNHLADSVSSSLYRDGKVLIRRNRDGGDDGEAGLDMIALEVEINDARQLARDERHTIDRNGFELLDQPLERSELDFYDHQQVVRNYYGACAQAVKQATGASQVFAFDHNIRSAAGKEARRRIAGGQEVQGPINTVHGDYTLVSGPQRLRDLAGPPGVNDTLRSVLGDGESLLQADQVERALSPDGRFALINLWRSIGDKPVETYPLALCDAQTVAPESLVVLEIRYHDRIGENYLAKHREGHGWWYYPKVTRDEALLIKQWDSKGGLAQSDGARADTGFDDQTPCTFSFHTAFDDLASRPDAPDRESIEVRCAVLYD